jgi:hypothetical protein
MTEYELLLAYTIGAIVFIGIKFALLEWFSK